MVRRRIPLLAVAVALALAATTACTDSTGGVATPGPTGGSTASSETGATDPSDPSSGGAEPTVDVPPRPRELSLDGIEPCSLFTQAQLTQLRDQLKIDQPPRPHTTGDRYKAPACGLEQSREPFHSFTVMLITSEGVGPWLSGERNVDAWLASVGGYPAVDYKLKGSDDDECATAVDVADGQQLTVDLIPVERQDYRKLCQMTEQVAAMALQTLQTLR